MNSERSRAVILCGLVSCTLVAAFTTGQPVTNPMSRMATMDALVHDGTFVIERSDFAITIDKVKIGDHFYSSKPPVLSVAGAAVYYALHHTTGISFRAEGAERETAVRTMNLILGGLPHLLLLVFAYRFLALYAAPEALLWSFASFAFGQLGLAYATTINNHVPAGVAALAGFYYAYVARSQGVRSGRPFFLAGFGAGLAPTLDLGTVFISAGTGLYLLGTDPRRALRWFTPGALLPLLAHFGLTRLSTGSFVPIYLRPELYRYPGSYWNAPTGIDALDEPRATYLWNLLLGHHGFFSMTPVLIVAALAIVRAIVRRGPHLAEAIVVGAALVVSITFYTLTTKNYGGVCVGFRWLLPITPLVLLFASDWLSRARRRASFVLFAALLAVGQFNAFDALPGPWASSAWDEFVRDHPPGEPKK